jgi:hypothetical protein
MSKYYQYVKRGDSVQTDSQLWKNLLPELAYFPDAVAPVIDMQFNGSGNKPESESQALRSEKIYDSGARLSAGNFHIDNESEPSIALPRGFENSLTESLLPQKASLFSEQLEFESFFETDLSNVNIKNDAEAAFLTQQLGVDAFTYGKTIYLSGNEPSKELLAHELTHVVQYINGATLRVYPDGDVYIYFTVPVSKEQLKLGTLEACNLYIYMSIFGIDESQVKSRVDITHGWTGGFNRFTDEDVQLGYKKLGINKETVARFADVSIVGESYSGEGGASESNDRIKTKLSEKDKNEQKEILTAADKKFRKKYSFKGQLSKNDPRINNWWSEVSIESERRKLIAGDSFYSEHVNEFLSNTMPSEWRNADYQQLNELAEIMHQLSPNELEAYKQMAFYDGGISIEDYIKGLKYFIENKRELLLANGLMYEFNKKSDAYRFHLINLRLSGTEKFYKIMEAEIEPSDAVELPDYSIKEQVDDLQKSNPELLKVFNAFGYKGTLLQYVFDYADLLRLFQNSALEKANEMLDQNEAIVTGEKERYESTEEVKKLNQTIEVLRPDYDKANELRAKGIIDFFLDDKIDEYKKAIATAEFSVICPKGVLAATLGYEAELAHLIRLIPGNAIDNIFGYRVAGGPGSFAFAGLYLEKRFYEARRLDQRAALTAYNKKDVFPILADPLLNLRLLVYSENTDTIKSELSVVAANRLESIRELRKTLKDNPERVFDLDEVITRTKKELFVLPNSVADLVIQEKISEIQNSRLARDLILAALGIVLGIASGGSGFLLLASLAVSLTDAYFTYNDYDVKHDAANAAFDKAEALSSEDPSLIWVALALVGVAFDAVQCVKLFKALSPAAKSVESTGEIIEFEARLTQLRNSPEYANLTEAIWRNLQRAAENELQLQRAIADLKNPANISLTVLLPFKELVHVIGAVAAFRLSKVAYYFIKSTLHKSFDEFIRYPALSRKLKELGLDATNPAVSADLRRVFDDAIERFKANPDYYSVYFPIKGKLEVPFKKGMRSIDFDEEGKMILDGDLTISSNRRSEVYQRLGLNHAFIGHGSNKPIIEVINEARLNPSGASGIFRNDRAMIESYFYAAEKYADELAIHQSGLFVKEFEIPNSIDIGDVYILRSKLSANVEIIPMDKSLLHITDVVKVRPTKVRIIFNNKKQVVSMYPIL